jgi:tetratricopeptide (TPR) repeat protein
MNFSNSDRLHLRAAEGWLELGNWLEATEELERITPQLCVHPDVLRMRVEIYSAAKKWDYAAEVANALCRIVPDESYGYIRLALALRELKRIKEAFDTLFPVVDKFPDHWLIPYNLACYTCQLGRLDEARQWFDRALSIGDEKKVKLAALDDPDLAPLLKSE